MISTGKLKVNLDAKTVEVDATAPVHLTGKEYQMLELLSLRKGTTLTKEMFLNHLYGGMDEPELKIIDVFICKLTQEARLRRRAATITSKPYGAAATCCVTLLRSRARRNSGPNPSQRVSWGHADRSGVIETAGFPEIPPFFVLGICEVGNSQSCTKTTRRGSCPGGSSPNSAKRALPRFGAQGRPRTA